MIDWSHKKDDRERQQKFKVVTSTTNKRRIKKNLEGLHSMRQRNLHERDWEVKHFWGLGCEKKRHEIHKHIYDNKQHLL